MITKRANEYDDEVITTAQDLRNTGHKYDEIQTIIQRRFKVKPTHGTMHRWFKEGDRDRISLLTFDVKVLTKQLEELAAKVAELQG